MDNAIYISLARQAALIRQMDVVANNVANVSTPGFKSEQMMFREYMVNDKDDFSRKIVFPQDFATVRDQKAGPLIQTNRPLDMTVEGDGYFVIQTPQGLRYTRSGNFTLNNENQIVTAQGYPVLDTGGQPISLLEEDEQITILGDGTVLAKVAGEPDPGERGIVQVVQFKQRDLLEPLPNGLYKSEEKPVVLEQPGIVQGAVEGSNTDSIRELTNMIKIERGVGSVTGFMSDAHDLQQRLIQTYTRAQ